MPGGQSVERRLQRLPIQSAAQFESPGQVVSRVAGLEPVQEPEPLLDER